MMTTTQESPGLPWAVRAMASEDIPQVAGLAAQDPTAPHWPVHEYHRMLSVIAAAPGRRGAWVLAAPAKAEAVPAGFSMAGFSMAVQVAGISELEAVVVRAPLRGRRLGEALVEAAKAWAADAGALRMELEVRASNASALRLYQRMGFAVGGRRSLYYRNPDEDAVLMSLAL